MEVTKVWDQDECKNSLHMPCVEAMATSNEFRAYKLLEQPPSLRDKSGRMHWLMHLHHLESSMEHFHTIAGVSEGRSRERLPNSAHLY
jgi:hypothetical protein